MDFRVTAFIISSKGGGYMIAHVFVCLFVSNLKGKWKRGQDTATYILVIFPTNIKAQMLKRPIFFYNCLFRLHCRCEPHVWVLGGSLCAGILGCSWLHLPSQEMLACITEMFCNPNKKRGWHSHAVVSRSNENRKNVEIHDDKKKIVQNSCIENKQWLQLPKGELGLKKA